MQYKTRAYPLFSACGLNCGLCPRFHADGASRCPGCAGEGFGEKHPSCGVLSCCQRKGLEYCYMCDEYPCKKYDGADQFDSFITHKNQLRDLEKAKKIGMAAYQAELDSKVQVLEHLLEHFDDGRRKSFFCAAVNLLALDGLRAVIGELSGKAAPDAAQKDKAQTAVRLLEELAERQNMSLQLRKKTKKKQ